MGKRRRFSAKRRTRKSSQKLTYTRVRGIQIPDVTHCKLVQHSATTAGSIVGDAVNVYNGNSLYDPDKTGAGTQPRYFDQYMGLYTKYFVHGVRVVADICIDDSTTNSCVYAQMYATRDASPIVGIPPQERPDAITKIMLKGGTRGLIRMSKYFSIAKIMSMQKKAYNVARWNAGFYGTASANPSSTADIAVGAFDPRGGNVDCTMSVTLTYFVSF